MKKVLFILIVTGLSGLLGWKVYEKATASSQTLPRQRQAPATAVEVAAVERADLEERLTYTGSLESSSRFVLAPKIAGRLEKVLVHIGDPIRDGQLVAVLEDDEYRQALLQSKAELAVARATLQERENTLANAGRELERTVILREKKIASQSELDAAESEFKTQQAKLDVARAQVAQAEASLKIAEVRLSYTQIRVADNRNGSGVRVVGERFVDEGALLAPNTPIVSIMEIGRLLAAIYVIERDYPKITPGLTATLTTDAFPGQIFTGKVLRLAPLINEASRQARVEIEVPNPQGRLKPGMFTRVSLTFGRRPDTPVVPTAALIKRGGQEGVFVVDRETATARFVPVETGIRVDDRAEILAPAITGEVVTLGQHLLEDEGAILLPDAADAKRPAPQGGDPKPKRAS